MAEIAHLRGVVVGTIYGHLEIAARAGEVIDVNGLVSAEAQRRLQVAAFKKARLRQSGAIVESLSAANTATANASSAALQMKQERRSRIGSYPAAMPSRSGRSASGFFVRLKSGQAVSNARLGADQICAA